MNKPKGSALIEIMFILPLFILCISLLETISEGYGARIQNRLLSRYVSTHTFREGTSPSLSQLKEKFFIQHPLTIQNIETTQITFHPFWQKNSLTLTQHFFLWRKNHDSIFETTRSSDEEEEF